MLRGVLVGCGYIAPSHLRAWAAIRTARIDAVVDRDRQRAEYLAREFKVGEVFEDVELAVRTVHPAFIDIATGPETHADLVRLGIRLGVHVLCQKPLAPDLEGAEQIVAAANGSDRVVAVNEMWKWLPGYRRARELLADGLAGTVREARFHLSANVALPELGTPLRRGEGVAALADNVLAAGRRPDVRDRDYFLLMTHGQHVLDMVRSLLGSQAEVLTASISRVSPSVRGDDGAFLRLRFDSGSEAAIDLDWSRPGSPVGSQMDIESYESLAVAGTNGVLTVESARTLTWLPEDGDGWSETHTGSLRDAAFAGSQEDFVMAIVNEKEVLSPPADHIENMRLVHRAYELAGWPHRLD